MKNKKGFTLVEIIIVIAILVVIAGIFSVNMIKTLNKNKNEENKNVVSQVVSAADAYVSANPEKVEDLYNGYGYVDIPIGELRDGGMLSEDIKDVETGEKLNDDDIVRVKLETGNVVTVIYPVSGDDKNQTAWSMVAEDMSILYNKNTSSTEWCTDNANLYYGLYDSRYVNKDNYANVGSKLYVMNNDKSGLMYDENYDNIEFTATSCNVNPQVAGTYNITYSFKDPDLNVYKTKNRTIYVKASGKDVVKFDVKITPIDGEPAIVRGWDAKITIVETYKDGKTTTYEVDISNTNAIEKLKEFGYTIKDFSTESVGTVTPIVSKLEPNSDGSTPDQQKPSFIVVPDTYKLTFNPNKGTVSESFRIVTYKKPYGALPNPTRTGYDFSGWFTTATGGLQIYGSTIMDKLTDHTLYAHWIPKKYTVTFNGNTGSVSPSSKIVTYDDTYGSLPTPTKTGYTFKGWFTASSGGSEVKSSTLVQITSNQTLYARWEAKKFTVTFNANSGSVSTKTTTVTYDSTYGTLPTPSRSSYSFNGWYTASSGGSRVQSSTKVTITSDQTLYAHWSYNPPYVPSYSYSGSSGRPSGGSSSGGGSSTPPAPSCDLVCQMAANSEAWWHTNSATERANLEAKQAVLTEKAAQQGIVRESPGVYTKNGQRIYTTPSQAAQKCVGPKC